MNTPKLLKGSLIGLLFVSSLSAEELLINETFSGLNTVNLNGTSAETFDSALTTAGGVGTWSTVSGYLVDAATAESQFKADGSVTGSNYTATYLQLGTYVNDAKGADTGIFTLQATLSTTSTGGWVSVGFFQPKNPTGTTTSNAFFDGTNQTPGTTEPYSANGMATALIRGTTVTTGDEYYAGPGSATGTRSHDLGALTGSVTYTIQLDLSNYNGSDDFGSVSYSRDGGSTVDFSYDYTQDYDFQSIGFSKTDGATGSIGNFTLTQIPETSTLAYLSVLGCATLLMLLWRSRANLGHQS